MSKEWVFAEDMVLIINGANGYVRRCGCCNPIMTIVGESGGTRYMVHGTRYTTIYNGVPRYA